MLLTLVLASCTVLAIPLGFSSAALADEVTAADGSNDRASGEASDDGGANVGKVDDAGRPDATDESNAESVAPRAEELELTEAERRFAADSPTLRVGLFPGREPMSYVDETGQLVGVSRDVLERISRETGFTFEYVLLDGEEPLDKQAEDLSLDIIAGCALVLGADNSYGYTMSAPYSSTRAVVAFNSKYDYNELSTDMVMAVTYELADQYRSLGYEVLACPTVADCLAAVDSGDAAYTYDSSHVVPVILGEATYDNVLTVDASFQNVDTCLAIVHPDNEEVLSILNKAIQALPARDVIAMVYDHTYANYTVTLRDLISRHPMTFALIIAVPLLVVVAALGFFAFTRSQAASRDPLTQLLNASTFRRKVLLRARRGEGKTARCLLIIDIDDFKKVNDQYGHLEGDHALKAVATALKAACRKGEYSARMGGDEFLAFWEGDGVEDIVRRADDLLEAITAEVGEVEAIASAVTASIGMACVRSDESYDDLYRRADDALYQGKKVGKGRAFLYE